MFGFKFKSENERIDYVQKVAWMLVRSAEDRIGSGRGTEKLLWCVDEIKLKCPFLTADEAEDNVRAAFVNFKYELQAFLE